MEQKFKIGDVVQLKSGGQHMTVSGYDPDKKSVSCEWMQKDGFKQDYLKSSTFHEDMLKKIE